MRFSKILSIILHPLFMPLITIKTTLFVVPSLKFSIYSYLDFISFIVSLSTIIFPILLIVWLVKINSVSSLEITNHKERPKPLIFSAFIMFIGYVVLEPILSLTPILKAEFLAAIIIVGLSSFISRYWKISLHMLGAGGSVGAFVGLHLLYGGLSYLIILAIILSGILGVARLNEKAHNHAQIYVGFLLGSFIQLSCLLLMYYNINNFNFSFVHCFNTIY